MVSYLTLIMKRIKDLVVFMDILKFYCNKKSIDSFMIIFLIVFRFFYLFV